MTVPITSEVTISRAWTHPNEVGALPGPAVQARGSSHIAPANRGHISQVQTPTATRNADQRRESTTAESMPTPAGIFYTGSKTAPANHRHTALTAKMPTPATPPVTVATMVATPRAGTRPDATPRRRGRPHPGRAWQSRHRTGQRRWARRWRRRLRRLLLFAGLLGAIAAAAILAARQGVNLDTIRRFPLPAQIAASIGLIVLAALALLPGRRP